MLAGGPGAGYEIMPLEEELEEEDNMAIAEETGVPDGPSGPGPYEVQDPSPSSPSMHDLSRSRALEDPPRVPRSIPRGAGPPAEDMAAALAEAARDKKEME